ncbi:MAG: hypothetical protein KJ747_03685 [Actinobacteria bacterium]|nr:hypothetical protein [Actinomycetota bacterium]
MPVFPCRVFVAIALLISQVLVLTGCAGGVPASRSWASQSLKRPVNAPITQEDEGTILALATESLEYERASGFSDVRSAPLTPEEIDGARLGEMDRGYRIIPAELASDGTIFGATRVADENAVSVPVIVGERYIAELGFERIDGQWEPRSTGCEAPHQDLARAEVNRAIPGALGGSPEETRSVNVDGSLWVIAKRGSREAAGLIDVYAYGCFGDTSVSLPSAGSVLTDVEFRALLREMKPRQ